MLGFASCFEQRFSPSLTSDFHERKLHHRARVVATLSELEKLHAAGVGAKERTRSVAGILESPRRCAFTLMYRFIVPFHCTVSG